MTYCDKDVVNVCLAPQHATIGAVITKGSRHFPISEETPAFAEQQWLAPPKRESITSLEYKLPDYHFITSAHELQVALERLASYPTIGIAIGTTGSDPFIDRIRTIQLSVDDQPAVLIGCDNLSRDAVALLCEFFHSRTSTTKVVHNGKIILKFLRQIGVELSPPYFDTMLASHLIKGGLDATHDLKSVAKAYLNEDVPNIHGSFSTTTLTEEQLQHAAHVARIMLALHEVLLARLEEAGLVESMQLECACLPAVADMELNGMLIDMAQWRKLQYHYTKLE